MATLTIPPEAYVVPTQDEIDGAANYWEGYKIGQPWAQFAAPNPGDFGKYAAESQDSQVAHGMWQSAYQDISLPTDVNGVVNATTSGMNSALKAGMDWLWIHDPLSPKNKVY